MPSQADGQTGGAPKAFQAGKTHVYAAAVTAAVIVIGLAMAVAAGFYSRRLMVLAKPDGSAQIAAARPGATLNVVLEVTSAPGVVPMAARLLVKDAAGYHRTAATMILMLRRDTAIQMGERADIGAGAILQVRGTLAANAKNTLIAKHVVVLTKYVSVH